MVAESFAPGAVVRAVARRWQVCPQRLFGRRREARLGLLASALERTGSPVPRGADRPEADANAPRRFPVRERVPSG